MFALNNDRSSSVGFWVCSDFVPLIILFLSY